MKLQGHVEVSVRFQRDSLPQQTLKSRELRQNVVSTGVQVVDLEISS